VSTITGAEILQPLRLDTPVFGGGVDNVAERPERPTGLVILEIEDEADSEFIVSEIRGNPIGIAIRVFLVAVLGTVVIDVVDGFHGEINRPRPYFRLRGWYCHIHYGVVRYSRLLRRTVATVD